MTPISGRGNYQPKAWSRLPFRLELKTTNSRSLVSRTLSLDQGGSVNRQSLAPPPQSKTPSHAKIVSQVVKEVLMQTRPGWRGSTRRQSFPCASRTNTDRYPSSSSNRDR